MVSSRLSTVLLAVAGFATIASGNLVQPRLSKGSPIDTLQQFPHHVTIEKQEGTFGRSVCGGSILNEEWVLTSAYCVGQQSTLQIQFERLYINNNTGSYAAVVNSDAVHIHPTHIDDVALVKLPFRLVFSDYVKPVRIALQPVDQLENKLAVMPGFDVDAFFAGTSGTSPAEQLNYLVLHVISKARCMEYYSAGDLDEYQQFCAEGYGNNRNSPCTTDYGSGLVVGWPAKPELVGIFASTSYECSGRMPAVFVNIANYAWWIQSVINS